MEKYRKILKTRITLLTLPAILAVALGIYDVFFATETIKESLIFGFQCGATTALGILSIILIIRFRTILKDDTKLKLQYNKENDERLKTIQAKAGMPMLLITSMGMIVVAIIAGYSDLTVFVTLIVAAGCQIMIGAIIKLIYLKKM